MHLYAGVTTHTAEGHYAAVAMATAPVVRARRCAGYEALARARLAAPRPQVGQLPRGRPPASQGAARSALLFLCDPHRK